MDRLPLELLCKICAHLQSANLKILRITNSRLQPAAELALFHTIYVDYSLKSLENLRKISCRPGLRPIVRFINYKFSSFKERETQELNFHKWLNSTAGTGLSLSTDQIGKFLSGLTRDKLLRLQAKYRDWMIAQNAQKSHQTVKHYLSCVMRQLPGLSGFHFSGLNYGRPSKLLVPPLGSYGGISQIIALPSSDNEEYLLKDEIDFWDFYDALSDANMASQMQKISVSRCTVAVWNSKASHEFRNFETLSKLEELSLDFRFNARVDLNDTVELRALLAHAPALRSLHISLEEMISIEDTRKSPDKAWKVVSLSDLFAKNQNFKYLTHLSLEALITTEPELRHFMKRHSNTLRSLVLMQVHFGVRDGSETYQGSWVEFFQFLNEEMALESAQFRRFFSNYWDEIWRFGDKDQHFGSECSGSRVEQYVTRRGPNPFTRLNALAERGVLRWGVESDDSLRNFGGIYPDIVL